jgi:3-deoxy-D-arabino-heptulosonate 7-phosphate (DAHP) synthase
MALLILLLIQRFSKDDIGGSSTIVPVHEHGCGSRDQELMAAAGGCTVESQQRCTSIAVES